MGIVARLCRSVISGHFYNPFVRERENHTTMCDQISLGHLRSSHETGSRFCLWLGEGVPTRYRESTPLVLRVNAHTQLVTCIPQVDNCLFDPGNLRSKSLHKLSAYEFDTRLTSYLLSCRSASRPFRRPPGL